MQAYNCCHWQGHREAANCLTVCAALQDCLAAQQQRPLLSELGAALGQDRELVVSCAAVAQFELLLQQFSGPTERQRWSELLPRLRIFHCSSSGGEGQAGSNASQHACCVCGELVQQHAANGCPLSPSSTAAGFALSERLQSLEKMSLMQQAVFSLGDALHALTLTANGGAVRAAAACGVVLDVQQHRPVWLTGL